MKINVSFSAIASTAAVTSVFLASFAAGEAYSCMFGKNKGVDAVNSGNSPTLTDNKLDLTTKMAIAGVGITAVAGVVAAGVVYQARRARLVDASQKEVSSDVTVEEVLYAPASDEKAPASRDKDLTLVR